MAERLSSWLSHPALIWGLGCASVLLFVVSLVLVPVYLARLPRDYLREGGARSQSLLLRVVRNLAGVVLVLVGVAMLVLPGQGLLTLLVGLLLLDFPRKRQLLRSLLGRPHVLAVVNKLRSHRGAPPLEPV